MNQTHLISLLLYVERIPIKYTKEVFLWRHGERNLTSSDYNTFYFLSMGNTLSAKRKPMHSDFTENKFLNKYYEESIFLKNKSLFLAL